MSFSPVHSRSPGRRGPSPGGPREEPPRSTIFVGNLAPDTDEQSLKDFFSKFGYVTQVKVVMDQETGKPRGFGFITFEDIRDAQDAVVEGRGKPQVLDGNTLRVNVAKYPRGGLPHQNYDRRQGPPMRGRGGPARYDSGRGRSRSRSLGRYSPGRYSPGRYSPNARGSPGRGSPGYSSDGGRSRSRSVSRGRSGSPLPSPRRRRSPGPPGGPAARGPGYGPPPQQGRPPKRRAGRSPSPSGSYSRSGSYSSYSSSGSEGSRGPQHRGPAALTSAGQPAGPAGNAAAELQQARRREAEMSTRIAALEAKVKSGSSAHGELQGSVQELSHRLQKAEDTCSHYRKWLTAVAECAKALSDSKTAVAAAEKDVKVREEDLTVLVGEAATFMEKERARASKRARRHRDVRAREPAENLPANGVPDAAIPQPMVTDAAAVDPAAVADHAPSGWAEQGVGLDDQGRAAQQDDLAAKFKPGIKFKLGV